MNREEALSFIKNFVLEHENQIIFFFIFIILLIQTAVINLPTPASENLMFGWEYGNIAESLASGKGYSNPFRHIEGPTGWMPPLLSAGISLAFFAFGIKTIASLWLLLTVKALAITVAWFLLYLQIKSGPFSNRRALLLGILSLALLAGDSLILGNFSDAWLVDLLLVGIYCTTLTLLTSAKKNLTIAFGLIGFFAPLISPIATISLLLTLVKLWLHSAHKKLIYTTFAIILFSAVGWSVLNSFSVGRIVPVKSNFWFDFYFSNILSGDGVLTNLDFLTYHPVFANQVHSEYQELSEIPFMDRYKTLSFQAIRNGSVNFGARLLNRLSNALIYTRTSNNAWPFSGLNINLADIEKLRGAGVIFTNGTGNSFWLNIEFSYEKARKNLAPLELTSIDLILKNWQIAKHTDEGQISLKDSFFSFYLSGCASLSIIYLALKKKVTIELSTWLLVAIGFLGPYVLFSHYSRYQISLFTLLSVPIFLVSGSLLNTKPNKKP